MPYSGFMSVTEIDCIDAAAAGCASILGSACSVPPHAPPENVKALGAAAPRTSVR
jgi:hypothetical protein